MCWLYDIPKLHFTLSMQRGDLGSYAYFNSCGIANWGNLKILGCRVYIILKFLYSEIKQMIMF